jgi:autotransporter-associated beta strand protein
LIDSLTAARGRQFACWSLAFAAVCMPAHPAAAQIQRVLGLDISAHQGIISQTTWNNFRNVENRQFVFLRSSRGGTTGEDHRQGAYPSGDRTFYNLSQRYDDPYFVQNVIRATAAGIFAGSYHRSRADVLADTLNSDGITTAGVANSGTDDANHMIQMARAWMRPGYLSPVLDFEDGDGARTDQEMAQFALDFSNRIYDVMGIRPAIYVNGNYAHFVLGGGTAAQRSQLAQQSANPPSFASPAFPTLWSARWPSGSGNPYPATGNIQTDQPKDTYANIYGPWDDYGVTHPWSFWQYSSGGRLQSYNNGNSNLDFDVANGGIEFVKDQLVPAIWTNDSSGDWSVLANWNSGQTPTAPIMSPGQLTPTATGPLPTPRLPGAAGSGVTSGQHDTVILERPGADITVTLSTGTHNIRKLYAREALNITGGTLAINYVPSADSTTNGAQFSAAVSLGGAGNLNVHTLQVDAQRTFTVNSTGALSFNTLNLMPHASSPAKLLLTGDLNVTPLAGLPATLNSGVGTGLTGLVDLGGAQRAISVANVDAATDLTIGARIANGGLTKQGAGALALTGANTYAGDTKVEAGLLRTTSAFLADSADLYLTPGAVLDLTFAGTDTIDSLFLDGVSQAVGTWGAVGSAAQFTSPLIAGTGLLQVTTLVTPLPPLPADFNEDGTVDAADLTLWQGGYGAEGAATHGQGDADGDLDVDGEDFLVWQRTLGSVQEAQGATGAVPEPAAATLLIACGLTAAAARRRH